MDFHIEVERNIKQIGGAMVDVPEEIVKKGMKAIKEYIHKKYTFVGPGDIVYENLKEEEKDPTVITMKFWETRSKMIKAEPSSAYLKMRRLFLKHRKKES